MLDVGRGYDAIEKGDVIDVVYDPQNLDVNRAHLAAPLRSLSIVHSFHLRNGWNDRLRSDSDTSSQGIQDWIYGCGSLRRSLF